ncbi:MAG TPA: hypothetical protein VFQ85_09640 [Mycobacteriales bacterium]|nr:hypothetical protein [Mycobacteriales bacterium]
MKITAAVVREQGTTFAVVIVKQSAMQPHNRDETQRSLQPLFPGVPVVLMSQDRRGIPTYWGRRDISRFLAGIHLARLPWREYRVAS